MADGKRSKLLLTCAVVQLLAAAYLWWDLVADGFTTRGMSTPVLFTCLGFFWLFVALRRK